MRKATLASALVCAAVLSAVGSGNQAVDARSRSRGETLQQPRLAVYEWRSFSRLTGAETRRRLRFLHDQGFTTVYLDLGEYLDAADRPRPQPRLGELGRRLGRFVAEASRSGLAVQAVGASPTWTDPELRYLGPMLVRLVGRYNAAAAPTERLQGVQLDIESYRDPRFFADEQSALLAYLETIQGIVEAYRQVRAQPANHELQLGVAIPFWFDGEAGTPGPVGFGGATKPAAYHLIDMLSDLPEAYVLVMAYRNFTPGADGSISHLRGEFGYAGEVGARSGIVVGQEFADAEPAMITFHGRSRAAFKLAARNIARAYGHLPQFRGLSVDDVDAYMAADED
jgi:hypothetical protein